MEWVKHAWHNVNPGKELPAVVRCCIEIPEGSKGKYELDKESGLLRLDRVLFSSVHYPANYGFIPQTYCDDHDPLDILVISSIDLFPMSLVDARVIGAMAMIDNNEKDIKIISVALHDESVNHIKNLSELPPHTIVQLRRFFEDYKKLEHKDVTVEEFLDINKAYEVINDSIKLYHDNMNQLIKGTAV